MTLPAPETWLSPKQLVEHAIRKLQGIRWRIALQQGQPVFEHEATAGAFTMDHVEDLMEEARYSFSNAFRNAGEAAQFVKALETMEKHLEPTEVDETNQRKTKKFHAEGPQRTRGGVLVREHLEQRINRFVAYAMEIAGRISRGEIILAPSHNTLSIINVNPKSRAAVLGIAKSRGDWHESPNERGLIAEMDAAQEQLDGQHRQLIQYHNDITERAERSIGEYMRTLRGWITATRQVVQVGGKSLKDKIDSLSDELATIHKNGEYELAFAIAGRMDDYSTFREDAEGRITKFEDLLRRANERADEFANSVTTIIGEATRLGEPKLSYGFPKIARSIDGLLLDGGARSAFAAAGRADEYEQLAGLAKDALERKRKEYSERRTWLVWNRFLVQFSPATLFKPMEGAWGSHRDIRSLLRAINEGTKTLKEQGRLNRHQTSKLVESLQSLRAFSSHGAELEREWKNRLAELSRDKNVHPEDIAVVEKTIAAFSDSLALRTGNLKWL